MLRRARPLLGTFVEITVDAASDDCAWRAANDGFAAIADVHRLMSFHERDSDVSRINRHAHERAVEVDPRTWTVLRRARFLSRLSNGLFDCTVGGALVALGALPRCGDSISRDARATFRDVALLPGRRVRLRRPLAIDLGGIAKGFAVDEAVAAIACSGADAACVNAGGDLRVFGDRAWPVALRTPDGFDRLPALRNAALATSADTFAPCASIVDPATGRLRANPRSVSILAPTCMDADALTKVVWLANGPPPGLLERVHARAIVLGGATETVDSAAAHRAAG
jgi:thiamine biosynthesis lipoprotein